MEPKVYFERKWGISFAQQTTGKFYSEHSSTIIET